MCEPSLALPTSTDGPRERSRLRTVVFGALGVTPAAMACFALVSKVWPLNVGPLGFVNVLEEQLLLATILGGAVVALITRGRALVLSVVVAALAFGALFGSEWASAPGPAGRNDLSVLTWNLEFGSRTPEEAVSALHDVTSDIVALEELEPDVSAAIEADPTLRARYPYRLMSPRDFAWGMGLLSRYPLSATDSIYPPACLEALVAAPRGSVRVIAGHPRHAAVHAALGVIPVYDPGPRDARIATIREKIDRSLAAGERLVVVGDFNTTPTEPEYGVLTRGLRDTHVEVGTGPGWTWRVVRSLPLGFLRIDLQLSAGAIGPSSTRVACPSGGDHCQLFGTYQIDG